MLKKNNNKKNFKKKEKPCPAKCVKKIFQRRGKCQIEEGSSYAELLK